MIAHTLLPFEEAQVRLILLSKDFKYLYKLVLFRNYNLGSVLFVEGRTEWKTGLAGKQEPVQLVVRLV